MNGFAGIAIDPPRSLNALDRYILEALLSGVFFRMNTVAVSVAAKVALQCQMRENCAHEVTYIGEKGFIYCAEHAADRRDYERCRKMRKWELELLREGKALPSYQPITKAEALMRLSTN